MGLIVIDKTDLGFAYLKDSINSIIVRLPLILPKIRTRKRLYI